jgi:Tfp pilus assembly protein PilN
VGQERTDRVAALAAALSSRVPMDRLFRQLAYVLPDDAWLTGLAATAPSDASPAGAAPSGGGATGSQQAAAAPGVTIQGATYSHESVARVLARLAVLPTLDDVRLTSSARVQTQKALVAAGAKSAKKPRSVVTFTITASFSGGQR